MDVEAKIIIAFIFNRSGKTELTEAEFYLPLSMELGWLSSKEAQEFVKTALKQALLVKKDGMLQPNFQLDTIIIPLGFTPSKQLFSETTGEQLEKPLLQRIIDRICAQTHQAYHEIQQEIASEEKEKTISPEVAAVYVALKYHVDVAEWYPDIEQSIFQRK